VKNRNYLVYVIDARRVLSKSELETYVHIRCFRRPVYVVGHSVYSDRTSSRTQTDSTSLECHIYSAGLPQQFYLDLLILLLLLLFRLSQNCTFWLSDGDILRFFS
jgi:hypothetical protein